MPRSRSGTSKRVLARIQRLCCLGIDSEMLMPDLVREVMRLIPSRGGLFYWVGPNLKITNAYTTFSTTILELWLKEFVATQEESKLLRPLNQFATWPGPIPVLRFEQQLRVDRRAFLRSDYYNLLWRAAENCDPLILGVREADRVRGVLQVYRAPGEPSFDPYEVKMLEAVVGFVAHGMTPARLEDNAFADSDNRALFIADLDGMVLHAPPRRNIF